MAESDIERIVETVVAAITAKASAGEIDLRPDTTTREVLLNEKDDVRHVALGCCRKAARNRDAVRSYLQSLGFSVAGVEANPDTDCVDVAVAVAKKVASGECERGIVLDTDGIGASMVCNKVKGIRAALCYDMRSAINSREHSNANVMTIGGPFHNNAELCEMVKVWLELRFPGGTRWSAINKIMATERG